MAKKISGKEAAVKIIKLRAEGKTDAEIIAEGGEGELAEGYRWLQANPGVDPEEGTTAAPRPSRGTGASLGSAVLSPR